VALLPDDNSQLHEIARHLRAQDPSLAAYLAGVTRRRRPRPVLTVVYLFPVALLAAGLTTGVLALFVAGIVTAPVAPIAGAWLLRSPPRRRRQPAPRPDQQQP
jgi:hypothetical protein